MRTVLRLLHEGAKKYGSMPYLGEKNSDVYSTINFIDADEISDAFAAALLLHGFRKGDNISILAEGRSSWVLGEFGLLKAGCVSVPLSTKLSGDEIVFRLNHSASRAILVSENNFRKVVDALPLVEKKPIVICISPETGELRKMIAAAGLAGSGLAEGQTLLFYDTLVGEGRAAIARGTLLDGKPMKSALEAIEAGIDENDTVTICYTSGTTGNPKGIMLSHLNYWHNAHDAAEVVTVETGWKSLIMLPLDHSFAHTVGIYIFLYRGLAMYFVDARGGPMAALRNISRNLAEVNSDFLLTVPALSGNFMKKITQGVAAKGPFINGIFERGVKAGIARAGNGFATPPFALRAKNFLPWAIASVLVFPKLRTIFGKNIKFCVGGGALLEIRQQEFFNAIGVPIFQGYGLTENSPIICSNAPARHKFGTSGAIIPTLKVRIMKDDTTECARGEIGQIVTKGDSVMKGYYKNTEATASTIRDGWLWSGDLGFIDSDGFLVVTGREKALLIAADGEKYSPETIEEAIINTAKYVHQVMAYNEQNKFTTALVTLDAEALRADISGSSVDASDIINIVREDLTAFREHPDYGKIPAQWRPASFAIIAKPFGEDHGLVNSTMKLVRHKVRDQYRYRIDELYETGSPEPECEGNLQALRELGFIR
jgi:long-chain acyl-CoA synthetase